MLVKNHFKFEVLLVATTGAVGVFVLPWFWPLHQTPNVSYSYTYGFNNFSSWLAVAIMLAFMTLVRWRKSVHVGPGRVEHELSSLLDRVGLKTVNRVDPMVIAIISAVAVLSVVISYSLLTDSWYAEMEYFVPRLEMMALGSRPYIDFQFVYGPAMLYPCYWICLISDGFISIDAAYCLTLLMHWIAGIGLTAYVINRLGGTSRKTGLFILVLLPWLCGTPWLLGLTYTPLRFIIALASVLGLHQFSTGKLLSNVSASVATVLAGSVAFVLVLANFALSPEMGFVVVVALVVYFIWSVATRLIFGLVGAGFVMLSLAVVWSLFQGAYFRSVLSTGDGNLNFPIFPTFQVIALLLASSWILPLLALIALFGINHHKTIAPISSALLVVLGLLIPVALGRCDIGHVYFNGFGIFIAYGCLAGQTFTLKNVNRLWRLPFILFGCFAFLGFWAHYRPQVVNVLRARLGEPPFAVGEDQRSIYLKAKDDLHLGYKFALSLSHIGQAAKVPLSNYYFKTTSPFLAFFEHGTVTAYGADLAELLVYKNIGTPLGSTDEIDRFLKITGHQVPEYYCQPVSGVFKETDLTRKYHDLSLMEVILVPESKFNTTILTNEIMLRQADIRSLSLLMLFPAILPAPRHPAFDPNSKIISYISAHYLPIGHFRNNIILRRKV